MESLVKVLDLVDFISKKYKVIFHSSADIKQCEEFKLIKRMEECRSSRPDHLIIFRFRNSLSTLHSSPLTAGASGKKAPSGERISLSHPSLKTPNGEHGRTRHE
jgi:hypothetical protein